MKLLLSCTLLAFNFSLMGQCAEVPSIGTTGGNCLGIADLSTSNVIGGGQLIWFKNDQPVLTVRAAYSSSGSVAGGNGPGSSSNQLNNPAGIFVDRNGNIYVADMDNHRVQKFPAGGGAGVTVAGGNGAGGAINQLNTPNGVSVDNGGTIYICDQNNHRIVKWMPGADRGIVVSGGNGAGAALNQLNAPAGFFVDHTGNIFVADSKNDRVVKWGPDAASGIVVAGGNGPGTAANQISSPRGIAVDTAGNVFVSDKNNRVQLWSPGAISGKTVAGTGISGYANNLLNSVNAVFIDPLGNLIIADGNNNRIQRWVQGAYSATTIAGGNGSGSGINQLAIPAGVFVDIAGNLFISDKNNHRIQKWIPELTTTLAAAKVPGAGLYHASIKTFGGCDYVTGNVIIHPSGRPNAKTWSNVNNDICPGDTAVFFTFLVTEAVTPTYQWRRNNINVAGADSATLVISDISNGDQFSCHIVCNANGCLTTDTITVFCKEVSLGRTYTFFGNGDWHDVANWTSGRIPPKVLAGCSKIIISPSTGGQCVLNKPQILSPGANLEVLPDSKFIINGKLAIGDGTTASVYGTYTADTARRGTGANPPTATLLAGFPFYERLDTARLPRLARPVALPQRVELDMPEPGDQGNRNSCAGWAAAYGLLSYIHNSIERNKKGDGSNDYSSGDKTFSPAFIYNQLNGGKDSGITLPKALEMIRLNGCCKMADMPQSDDFLTQPTPEARKNAFAYSDVFAINELTGFSLGAVDINLIKNILASGWPLLFSAKVDPSFFACRGPFVCRLGDGRLIWYDYSYKPLELSHFMVLCGYDDDISAFKVMNSWGTDIANGGFYWIDTTFFKDFVCRFSVKGVTYPEIYGLFRSRPDISINSNPASAIGSDSAKFTYSITNNDDLAVVRERGICYSKENLNPTTACTLNSNITEMDDSPGDGSGAGIYNMTIRGLEPNTMYYFRSYAKTSEGVIYSQPLSFLTDETCDSSVTIGSQVWSCKNLDVATYKNGDLIPHVTDSLEWTRLTTGAWCWFRNDSATYAALYGRLYNWYAVNDSRGLAPQGWHVPDEYEWNKLVKYLDEGADTTCQSCEMIQSTIAGGAMKSTTLWASPNTGASNSSGFSGLPGGLRVFGRFNNVGYLGMWWSASDFEPTNTWSRQLTQYSSDVWRTAANKSTGLSVRCIRD